LRSGDGEQRIFVHSDDAVLRALMDTLAARGRCVWHPSEAGSVPTPETVVLVDVDSAEGMEVLRELRARLGADTYVIAVSRAASRAPEGLLEAGADDLLLRPMTSEALEARLAVARARSAERRAHRKEEANEAPPTSEPHAKATAGTYRMVLEALSYPVFLVRDHELVFANRVAAELLGYGSVEALLAAAPDGLFHPDEQAEAWARIRRALESDQPVPGAERRVVRADGETVTLAISPLRRLTFDGEPTVVVAARDVTEERLVEARLRLADRLTSVGTLAAGVAHEVNNPLASVVANLSVLEEELPALAAHRSEDERNELLEILADAREGADRVQQIVRDLSTFAKADATTLGLVDVNQNVEATLNIAAPQVRHRARVVCDLQPVPAVRGNEARLSQVLLHLVLNAVQAMPSGRASENELRVQTRVEGTRWVVIAVEDTGRGMPEEELRRIFEPFFTTKPVGEGIGLGLSISHSIIEQMGGLIDVTSTPNVGSVFTLRLPAASPDRRTRPEALSTRLPSVADILVADDEPMITRSLQRLLKGHRVTPARSGREALELLEQRSFDLIVCDLHMPDFTGIDVYERLAELRPGDEEKIVFMTGGAFTAETASFLDGVPNIWIEKPFDFKAVRALLEMELSRR
jgi:two-component system, cell cycle sensor histidine kinase and response regulator CckA